MNRITRNGLLGACLLAAIMTGDPTQKAIAQDVDPDTLCQNYPFNSRCEGYVPTDPEAYHDAHFLRQAIKIQLETTGSNDEFILIDIQEEIGGDITLSASHTERFEGILTDLLGLAEIASPVPVPLDLFQLYERRTHPTEYIAFTPDSCQTQPPLINGQTFQSADCSITGIDAIELPDDVDIRLGFFTLGYTEKDLIQTVTFRLEQQDSEFVDEGDINNLCERFPLNSQCRYWPISQVE